jgi:ribose 5-phosphate isomerase B
MRVAVAADHAGYPLYELVMEELRRLGHEAVGVNKGGPQPDDDYPDFSRLVGEQVQRGECQRGVVVCGSGVGAAVAANKMPGIRAGLCHDTYSAHQGVEHDDMNVLCLGAKVVGSALALELVGAFVNASFDHVERHQRRLDKVLNMEKAARG